MFLYKPFRRGDRIQIAAPTKDEFEVGTVEDISLGYTVHRPDDGREIIIANGALGRKSWLFAGSDRGGQRTPFMLSLIRTAKLNDIDPQAWLADVLSRIANISQNRCTSTRLQRGHAVSLCC